EAAAMRGAVRRGERRNGPPLSADDDLCHLPRGPLDGLPDDGADDQRAADCGQAWAEDAVERCRGRRGDPPGAGGDPVPRRRLSEDPGPPGSPGPGHRRGTRLALYARAPPPRPPAPPPPPLPPRAPRGGPAPTPAGPPRPPGRGWGPPTRRGSTPKRMAGAGSSAPSTPAWTSSWAGTRRRSVIAGPRSSRSVRGFARCSAALRRT